MERDDFLLKMAKFVWFWWKIRPKMLDVRIYGESLVKNPKIIIDSVLYYLNQQNKKINYIISENWITIMIDCDCKNSLNCTNLWQILPKLSGIFF